MLCLKFYFILYALFELPLDQKIHNLIATSISFQLLKENIIRVEERQIYKIMYVVLCGLES